MQFKGLILVLLFIFFFTECKKDIDYPVPKVKVEIALNIMDDPTLRNLQDVGSFATLNGGYNGIVVYRKNLEEMVAYDLQCTYQVEDSCAIEPTVGTATCPCCGSVYELYFGSAIEGPAKFGLVQYRVQYTGSYIFITNY